MTLERVHGEVEFEFREDAQGGGEFLACGKVISALRSYLAAGQVKEAAMLLAACAENVGDELIADALGGGASSSVVNGLAQMFFLAKDYGRAAVCAERVGDHVLMARCFEANYDYARAAECYQAAGQLPKAAALFERHLSFDRAAALYLRLGDLGRAAENLERLQQYDQAGELYVRLSRLDKAVDVLQRVEHGDPSFVRAVHLLGRIFEHTNNPQSAMQAYAAVVRQRPLDEMSLPIHVSLARLSLSSGLRDQATRLLMGVLRVFPNQPEARALLVSLEGEEMPAADDGAIVVDLQTGAHPAVAAAAGEATPTPITRGADRLVGVDRDFEFLHHTALFSALSLDELKVVQRMCEKVTFPKGVVLIRQGQPGEALYVMVRGTVAISTVGADGQAVPLGDVRPGAHLGEMSLLDDAPTSATAIARQEVVAFRLPRRRFEEMIQANERIQLRIYTVMVGTLVARLREANAKLAAAQKTCHG